MTAPAKSIMLVCQDGTSDKVYGLSIEAQGDGYAVNFRYGRRGSKLRLGSKTPKPVLLVVAERIYNEAVADKLGHGYLPDDGGSEIEVLTQTKMGRHMVRDFASALQVELWARKYGFSWGVREEFVKVIEDHPELLDLQVPAAADRILCNLTAWSPALAEKEAKAKAAYVSPDDAEKARSTLEIFVRAIRSKTSVGPEIAEVFVCRFSEEFTNKLGKPDLRAVMHGDRLVEVLDSEEAAIERANWLVGRIRELEGRRSERLGSGDP